MPLIRLVQINLAVAAVLGTLLLGSAEGSVALPLLALATAAAAFYWTDLCGRIRLSGGLANLAALVAVAISVSEVMRADMSDQLVAIANLLIYLQTILLFQEKTVRVGWQLLSLSLLQVVVAAAIGDSILFGVLVVVYLVFALSGVALLCCYGESLWHGATFGAAETKPMARWGWSWRAAMLGSPTGGADRAAVAEPPRDFYRGLARCLLALAAGSVLMAGLLFVAMPRYSDARLMTQRMRPNVGMTSFTPDVNLNSSGRRIFEDAAIVMRLKLVDDASGKPYLYSRELYLRGGVAYDYRAGNWTRGRNDDREDLPSNRSGTGMVRQEFDLEPMPHERLFSVYPVASTYEDPRIRPAPLRRVRHDVATEMAIGTSGFHLGQQLAVTPCTSDRIDRTRWTRLPNGPNGQSPEQRFDGLIRWARDALAGAGIALDDRIGAARLLEERLRDFGEFRYSLAMPERNAKKDPIEDFVTEHRQGNCEFFASALALMLRSQGIPARMVMGYRSADWNPVGGYLQVRQLHAHTWVEAYLEPSQIPASMKSPQHDYAGGGWLRLDPTPADEGFAAAAGTNGLWARIKNLFDHVDLLWRNYIVGFDRARQQRMVYSPLEELVDAARWGIVAVFDLVGWLGLALGAWVLWMAARLMGPYWPAMPRWAAWARLGGWLSLPRWRRRAEQRSTQRVSFYDRFERIAARAGYRRLPQQTPLEFAKTVGGQLFDMPQGRIAARAPRQVVEAFYRVRYGGHALADDEAADVERALVDLERVLSEAGT